MRRGCPLVLAALLVALLLPVTAGAAPVGLSGSAYLQGFVEAFPVVRQLAVYSLPVAVDDYYEMNEDAVLQSPPAVGLFDNDSHSDGTTLTLVSWSWPAHGTPTGTGVGMFGTFTYTPQANWNGTETYTYRTSDGVNADDATVTIKVLPVNDVPVASADATTVAEDTTLTIPAPGLLANDSDVDGDGLSAYAVTGVSHGTLYLSPNGGLTYRAASNWYGTDSFTYRVYDGAVFSAPVAVTLTVAPVNDLPVVASDAATVTVNTTLTVAAPGVLANDSDTEGTALTAAIAVAPAHGALQLATNGGYTYRPTDGWTGTDTFSYRASDGTGLSAAATVTVAVVPNTPPVAAADAAGCGEDTTLTVPAPGVLENDTDATPGLMTAHLVSGVAHGTLSLASDGSYTYRPLSDWNGTDTFSYRAHDGQEYSAPATVTISVNPVNDAPVAVSDTATAKEGTTLTVLAPGLLANDTDAEGSALSVSLHTSPLHGTVSLGTGAEAGAFSYRPSAGWTGTDTFTYRANDGSVYSSVATVTVTVLPRDATTIARTSAATTISYGGTYTFKGRVTATGTPVPLVDVLIEKSSNGTTFTPTGIQVICASDGRFSVDLSPKSKTWYRARFVGNALYGGSMSSAVAVSVRASVGTPVAPKTAKRNKPFTVYGSLKPRHTAAATTSTVRIYRYRLERKKWKSYGYVTVKVYNYSTYSRYSASLALSKTGTWRLRAYHSDAGHAKAWSSKYDYVTVK